MKTEEYETKIKELSPKNFFPLIQKGILVSKKYHEGQERFSGEPYVFRFFGDF